MNDARLTEELASTILGWRTTPTKYLKEGRSWIPKSRFQPLKNDRDASRLLDAMAIPYTLLITHSRGFTVELKCTDGTWTAAANSRARAITLAIAQQVGIDVSRHRTRRL